MTWRRLVAAVVLSLSGTFYAKLEPHARNRMNASYARQIVRLMLVEALRSRLAWLALTILLAAFGLAWFLAQVAIVESDQIQIALVAAVLRAGGVFLLATFVISSTVREANDKVTELLLSQPVPRWVYLGGKLAGCAVLAAIIACGFALALSALSARWSGAMAWGASLGCELMIMSAVSVFCALSMTQVLPSLAATAAFYLLARSVETIRDIAAGPLAGHEGLGGALATNAVEFVAVAVPNLDHFSLTRWLYDLPPSMEQMADI